MTSIDTRVRARTHPTTHPHTHQDINRNSASPAPAPPPLSPTSPPPPLTPSQLPSQNRCLAIKVRWVINSALFSLARALISLNIEQRQRARAQGPAANYQQSRRRPPFITRGCLHLKSTLSSPARPAASRPRGSSSLFSPSLAELVLGGTV